MGKVVAVCSSERKGSSKQIKSEINIIENFGIEGDAHAGNWHRQISLLSFEEIENFRKKGVNVAFGDCGENIVVSGLDMKKLKIGDIIKNKDITLTVTQIGKECHNHCSIYYSVGECIMPKYGIFTRVLQGGTLKTDDELILSK